MASTHGGDRAAVGPHALIQCSTAAAQGTAVFLLHASGPAHATGVASRSKIEVPSTLQRRIWPISSGGMPAEEERTGVVERPGARLVVATRRESRCGLASSSTLGRDAGRQQAAAAAATAALTAHANSEGPTSSGRAAAARTRALVGLQQEDDGINVGRVPLAAPIQLPILGVSVHQDVNLAFGW